MQRIRLWAVGSGAFLVTACLLVAFFGPLLFFAAVPGAAPSNGRVALVIPGVPLTVASIVVAGRQWTRKWHASTAESFAALLVLQLIAAVFWLALGARAFADIREFVFFSNFLFAPWWVLGHVVAVATGPENDAIE